MAAGLQGGEVLVFSIDTGSGAEETYGIVQTASTNESVERAEAKGPDGHTTSIQEYDDKAELNLSFLIKNTATGEPEIGTTFTYDTVVYYINSINSTSTVDGFKSIDVTATHYPNLGGA